MVSRDIFVVVVWWVRGRGLVGGRGECAQIMTKSAAKALFTTLSE